MGFWSRNLLRTLLKPVKARQPDDPGKTSPTAKAKAKAKTQPKKKGKAKKASEDDENTPETKPAKRRRRS